MRVAMAKLERIVRAIHMIRHTERNYIMFPVYR